MSDSDDTDILLVIPPNFFSIDSDDSEVSDRELSLCKSFRFKPKHREEKKIVSDLINNVSELAGRISALEDIEGLRHSNCGESFSASANTSFQTMNAFKESIDSLSQHSFKTSSNYLNRSPQKSTRPQSLPPTPGMSRCQQILEEFPKSHSLSTSPEKNSQFINKYLLKTEKSAAVSKNDVSLDRQHHATNFSEPGYRRRFGDFDSFSTNSTGNCVPDMEFKSCFTQSYLDTKNGCQKNSHSYDNPVKHLDLPEVDRLLKEMEMTEEELGSKSKPRSNSGSFAGGAKTNPFPKWSYDDLLSDPNRGVGNYSKKEAFRSEAHDTAQTKSSSEKNSCVRRLDFDATKPVGLQHLASGKDSFDAGIRKSTDPSGASFKTSEALQSGSTFPGVSALSHELYKIDSRSSIIEELRELDKKTQEIVANSLPHSHGEPNGAITRLLNSQMENNPSNELLKQKLEEEHQRRQHCENLVIDLQQEVLEWRERLAVAVAIDAEKNRAIGKLETTWRRTVEHWRQLEDQRHNLAVALQALKEERREEIAELSQKIRRNELELSQALDLAAGYKLKADAAEKERASCMVIADKKNYELATKLKEIEDSNIKAQSKLIESENRIQQLQDKLALMDQNCTEASIEDRLENYLDFMKQVEHQLLQESQERLGQLEAELSLAVAEKVRLLAKLKEQSQSVDTLREQKKDLLLALDEAKEREKKAQEDVKNSQQNQDKLKKELRVFYQKQLESVVRDKLKEFQSQLDSAEAALKSELHARERALAELAARQMQILNEKHKLEIDKLKEEKQEQMKNSESTISDLKQSLETEKTRRAEMARELHSVMETQWRQAINIIASQTNLPNKQEPTNEKGEPAVSIHAVENGYPTYKIENKTMPEQLQKYFQMLLENMPPSKEDLNNSWLYSSFLSEDIATSAAQGNELHLNPNNGTNSKSSKSKPPWK